MRRRAVYRRQYSAMWLRAHGRGERALERAVKAYFTSMSKALSDAISDGETNVVDLCDPKGKKLIELAGPHLARSAAGAAELELSSFDKPRKDVTIAVALDGFELPADTLKRIRTEIEATLRQPYWRDIGARTERLVTDALELGIDNGDSYRDIAKSVEDLIGGSRARALGIARTETTGAMNAGHDAARRDLIDDGLITGSEWLAMVDTFTREDHADADGQVIGRDEEFTVGDEKCPYPGYYGLSAEQRVRCRCTTVASGSFADDE